MANKFITALFGDYSKKEVKRLGKTKQKVLDLEEKYQAMDDKELTAQTAVLKTRLADGETLDDILPDAFAVCSSRTNLIRRGRPAGFYDSPCCGATENACRHFPIVAVIPHSSWESQSLLQTCYNFGRVVPLRRAEEQRS